VRGCLGGCPCPPGRGEGQRSPPGVFWPRPTAGSITRSMAPGQAAARPSPGAVRLLDFTKSGEIDPVLSHFLRGLRASSGGMRRGRPGGSAAGAGRSPDVAGAEAPRDAAAPGLAVTLPPSPGPRLRGGHHRHPAPGHSRLRRWGGWWRAVQSRVRGGAAVCPSALPRVLLPL